MSRSARSALAAAFCAFGWLSSFTYALHLIGPHTSDCADGNALPYLVSMIAGPATLALAALMLTIGSGLGATARWPVWLHGITLLVVAKVLPAYLVATSLEGEFICASNAAGGPTDHPVTTWQRAFVPVHNGAVVLFAGYLLWYWRLPRNGAPRGSGV